MAKTYSFGALGLPLPHPIYGPPEANAEIQRLANFLDRAAHDIAHVFYIPPHVLRGEKFLTIDGDATEIPQRLLTHD